MDHKLPLETLKLELIQWILAEQDAKVLHQLLELKGNGAATHAALSIRKTKREHGFGNRNNSGFTTDFDETPPGFDEYLK
jgi:hypothetical protein